MPTMISTGTPGWRAIVRVGGYAIAFRIVSAVLAFVCNLVFPLDRPEQFPTMFGATHLFWDPFARYDAGNFYQIARFGYTAGPMAYVPGGRSSIAYFPVYPLLMRAVGRLFGNTPADLMRGGIVVSWAAFVLAAIVLLLLARLDVPEEEAEGAVLLTAIFPFAFFFGAIYTEATFLLFTLASFYLFRRRMWIAGGLLGGLATATRVNGILMLPALAWIAWRGVQPNRRDRVLAIVGLLLVCAGIGAYSAYIYHLSGHPFEWAAAIQRWGYYPGGRPWLALARLVRGWAAHPYAFLVADRMAPYDLLNGLTAVVFIVSIPFVWWRFGAAYGLFMVANLWLPLSSGQYEGLGRYCAVLFPFFIWLASVAPGGVFVAAVVVSSMLYTLCLALFTTIHPIF